MGSHERMDARTREWQKTGQTRAAGDRVEPGGPPPAHTRQVGEKGETAWGCDKASDASWC